MTRYERWHDYREQIKNKSNIYEAKQHTEQALIEYKKRIIKINPKLLDETEEDEGLSFFSVNKFSPVDEFASIVNSYNYDFLNKLKNEILEMKIRIQKNNNKLTNKDGNFNEKYILDCSKFEQHEDWYGKIVAVNDEFINLSKITEERLKNNKIIKSEDANFDCSKNLITEYKPDKNKKTTFSKIYLASTILACVTFAIVLILVVLFETGIIN